MKIAPIARIAHERGDGLTCIGQLEVDVRLEARRDAQAAESLRSEGKIHFTATNRFRCSSCGERIDVERGRFRA